MMGMGHFYQEQDKNIKEVIKDSLSALPLIIHLGRYMQY